MQMERLEQKYESCDLCGKHLKKRKLKCHIKICKKRESKRQHAKKQEKEKKLYDDVSTQIRLEEGIERKARKSRRTKSKLQQEELESLFEDYINNWKEIISAEMEYANSIPQNRDFPHILLSDFEEPWPIVQGHKSICGFVSSYSRVNTNFHSKYKNKKEYSYFRYINIISPTYEAAKFPVVVYNDTKEIFEPETGDFLFLFNAFCTGLNIRVVAGRSLIVAIDSKGKCKYGQLNKKLMNYIKQRFYNCRKKLKSLLGENIFLKRLPPFSVFQANNEMANELVQNEFEEKEEETNKYGNLRIQLEMSDNSISIIINKSVLQEFENPYPKMDLKEQIKKEQIKKEQDEHTDSQFEELAITGKKPHLRLKRNAEVSMGGMIGDTLYDELTKKCLKLSKI